MKTINKRLEQLVNDKLEGSIIPEENLELEHLLRESEEARLYFIQMKEIHQSLLEAAEEKADVDVTEQVMTRVWQLHAQKQAARTFHLASYFSAYSKQMMRYAAMLAIGLILGSAFTFIAYNWQTDVQREDVSATISTRSSQAVDGVGSTWQLFTQPVVTGDMAMLVVSLNTDVFTSVNITHDPSVISLENTRLLNYTARPMTSSQPGSLLVESGSDVVLQAIYKRHPGIRSPLQLEVVQDGQVVHQREILFE